MQLPIDMDPIYFDNIYRLKSSEWSQAVFQICQSLNIEFKSFTSFSDGSNLVAGVGDSVIIKIFPPFHRHQWESEAKVLHSLLQGELNIPIPNLIGQGELSGNWTYVVLSRLPGRTIESVWLECSHEEKASILKRIGEIMAKVHSVHVGDLKSLDPKWSEFLNYQIIHCFERHKKLGMPSWFLKDLKAFVHDSVHLIPEVFDSVILTGEYTPFNLMTEKQDNKWTVSGMIDFGDAMIGFRDYDFLGPSLFLAGGNADLVRSLFTGYGYSNENLNAEFRRRLMLLQVLHRYSNFNFQLRIPGWDKEVRSIEELERLIWPFSIRITQ